MGIGEGNLVLEEYLASFIALGVTIILLFGIEYLFRRAKMVTGDVKLVRQLIQLAVLGIGLVFIIFSLPIPYADKESILQLLGIIAGAAIALSSTTFIANAMSGIMLRIIKPFRVGDYIESETVFGRVTDIHILHTEVQSIDRDLVTLPNLKLVSNPLKTIRTSGTIISTSVSLGYDVSWKKIEKNLLLAAEKTGLETPFVQVLELGDFSVTYKVGGLLKEVENLISVRSELKKGILDALHGNDIEIVSPNFMNQRVLKDGIVCIPQKEPEKPEAAEKTPEKKPEEIIFDKAIEAEILDRIEKFLESLENKEKELEQQVNSVLDESREEALKEKLKLLKNRKEEVKADFETVKKQKEGEEEKTDPELFSRQVQSLNLKADHLDIRRRKLERELKKIFEEKELLEG
ncbi:Mechanosensitive ion channel family protein [Methanosarcina sp. MTP4]|uniref:mechanosensitive ion channel family protein n=1 Tax=Methanosarcina sp. MTP4 TaxID=1434100 RepID=UPI00061615E9|nr:mechanosensitive ion channel domain-containing protein [Methanosarcina sp. MTP4]AKB25982.1 Mechanosensitive ion channel family protein [Methanosarcina sp. MTP4]